jgi:hypothetical protein
MPPKLRNHTQHTKDPPNITEPRPPDLHARDPRNNDSPAGESRVPDLPESSRAAGKRRAVNTDASEDTSETNSNTASLNKLIQAIKMMSEESNRRDEENREQWRLFREDASRRDESMLSSLNHLQHSITDGNNIHEASYATLRNLIINTNRPANNTNDVTSPAGESTTDDSLANQPGTLPQPSSQGSQQAPINPTTPIQRQPRATSPMPNGIDQTQSIPTGRERDIRRTETLRSEGHSGQYNARNSTQSTPVTPSIRLFPAGNANDPPPSYSSSSSSSDDDRGHGGRRGRDSPDSSSTDESDGPPSDDERTPRRRRQRARHRRAQRASRRSRSPRRPSRHASQTPSQAPMRDTSPHRNTPFNWRGLTTSWANDRETSSTPSPGSSPWTQFQTRIHEGIDRVLNQRLNRRVGDVPSTQYVKTLSASTRPPEYEGDDDLPTFMEWFQNLMTFLEIHQLVSRRADRQRVLVCGSALTGKAAHWYNLHYQRGGAEPSFREIIHILADRFITPAASIRAQNNFERVKYSLQSGIRAYISDLEILSAHMFQQIDEYSLRRHVLEAIPPKIRNDLMDHKGLSTTTSTLSAWVEAIERREHELLERSAFNEAATARVPNPRTRLTASRNLTSPPVRVATTSTPTPRNSERPTITPNRVTPRQMVPQADLKCYACGQKGHFRGSKDCPMTPRAVRLNVMATDDAQEELAETGEQTELDEPFEGIDYDGDPDTGIEYEDNEYGAIIASIQLDDEQDAVNLAIATTDSAEGDTSLAHDLVRSVKEQYELRGSGQPSRPTGRPPKQLKADAKKSWASNPNVRYAHTLPGGRAINRQGLSTIVKVDGIEAYTCFDSGSELDAISPDFTRAAGIDQVARADTLKVRLGTKGSSSATSYEAKPELDFGNRTLGHPLDILNLDRFDVLLGSPFCNQYKVVLDYSNRTIRFGNTTLKALSRDEEATMRRKGRQAMPHTPDA